MQGTEYIPLEEYLQGALAAYLLRGYNDEELKAISIVLRTNLVVDLERGLVPQLEQMSYARQRSEFAEQYDSNRKRILDILQETSGQILLYEGSVVEVPFLIYRMNRSHTIIFFVNTINYIRFINIGNKEYHVHYEVIK